MVAVARLRVDMFEVVYASVWRGSLLVFKAILLVFKACLCRVGWGMCLWHCKRGVDRRAGDVMASYGWVG